MLILNYKLVSERDAETIQIILQLIQVKPLRLKLIGEKPLGMNLLPEFMTLTTSYIIIILQFNNIF